MRKISTVRVDRVGFENKVGLYRAHASAQPEADLSPMTQELLARVNFLESHLALDNGAILDFGCGTGVALGVIRARHPGSKLVGIDISEGAVESAKRFFHGIDFRVANLESPPSELEREFDIALCLEVLEHFEDPVQAVSWIANHYLKEGGTLIASTPNRKLFSMGMTPSPINKTHLHEMDLEEFRHLLQKHFTSVQIYGMRFRSNEQRDAYMNKVGHSCDGYRILGRLWWNKWINRLYRWVLRGEVLDLLKGRRYRTWMAADFEFGESEKDLQEAIWFLGIAR